MLPLRATPSPAFAALRTALDRAAFTEANVARRVGAPSIHAFTARRDGRAVGLEADDPLGVLVRLFLDEEPLPWHAVERVLGRDTLDALRTLGLLRDMSGDAACCRAPALLYPTQGLLVASDLAHPDASDADAPRDDSVFPAITHNTAHFLTMLPSTPCDRLLELCGGTGIAALLAARHCRHTWATDITARATHFAEFNRLLNGLENVTTARGDLYEAVPGLTFDRIVAHPPYVPEPEVRQVFRDGGEDGEQVTRGIIRGLPAHLRPGGELHCTCAVTDRTGRPFEQRVRDLLGDAAPEFDVFFIPRSTSAPMDHFLQQAKAGRETFASLEQRHEAMRRLEVERVLYGSFVVRRHAAHERRPPLTVRRRAAPSTTAADVAWLMGGELALSAPGAAARLLDRPLRAAPHVEFMLVHAQVDGDWQATRCHVGVSRPLLSELDVPPWVAALLVRSDGSRSMRAVLAELRAEGMAPAEASDDELAALLAALVSTGALLE